MLIVAWHRNVASPRAGNFASPSPSPCPRCYSIKLNFFNFQLNLRFLPLFARTNEDSLNLSAASAGPRLKPRIIQKTLEREQNLFIVLTPCRCRCKRLGSAFSLVFVLSRQPRACPGPSPNSPYMVAFHSTSFKVYRSRIETDIKAVGLARVLGQYPILLSPDICPCNTTLVFVLKKFLRHIPFTPKTPSQCSSSSSPSPPS